MIIIHCPNCGAALSLAPAVANIRVDRTAVLVTLDQKFVEHVCPSTEADA